MATIYRFIIESKGTGGNGGTSGGRKNTSGGKGAGKKGKWVSIFGGPKGGVEHNRKMRAINPLLNKATGGAWEKGMRVGRAGMGLFQRNTETGKLRISGTALAIIISFVIQTVIKFWNYQRQVADKQNAQDFKQMQDGYSPIHGEYRIVTNFWTGKRTFNENK